MDTHPAEDRLSGLRPVLDCASDAMFVAQAGDRSEKESRILYVNDAFTRQTGYASSEAVGQPPEFLFGPKTDATAIQRINHALENAQPLCMKVVNYHKDGDEFWTELCINPMMESADRKRVVAIQRRLDDAQNAAQAQTEGDRQFEALANNLTEAVLVHRNMRPLFVNASYRKLFGYASMSQALSETSPLMNLTPEQRQSLMHAAKCCNASDAPPESVAFDALRTDGTALRLEARCQELVWHGTPATLMTIAQSPRAPVPRFLHRRMAERRRAARATGANIGAEAALAENEQLMRLLMDSVPVILAYKDTDLIFRFVNKTFADWLGLPREEIIGRHVSEVRDEKHYQMMRFRRADVLAGKTVTYEGARNFPGRGVRDLFSTLVPHKNGSGDVIGYFSMVQDITDLKDIERTLAQREEQLRLVMDSVPVLISYRDRNLCYRYVNRAHEDWYGVPSEQIIGRHTTDIISLSSFRQIKPYLDRALAGESVQYEEVVNFPHIGERNVLASYVPHKDDTGHVIGFFSLAQEVTRSDEGRRGLK